MSNNKNPNEKQPGEKGPGTFHYNPGNMSGKTPATASKDETEQRAAVTSDKTKTKDGDRP